MTAERSPLLYGWARIHRFLRDRGIPVSRATLEKRWSRRFEMPIHRPEGVREVVADPDRLEEWIEKHFRTG